MFYLQAYDIAKAEQAAREAQMNRRAATGLARDITPNAIQRMFAVLRSALMARRNGRLQGGTRLVTRGTPAR